MVTYVAAAAATRDRQWRLVASLETTTALVRHDCSTTVCSVIPWSMSLCLLTLSVQRYATHYAMFLKPRLHQDTCCRIQVVSTCRRRHISCIGDKTVASLSPVCCWIQRDTSRPWHKWIVIMSRRYSQHVSRTSYLYPATCVRRHICIRI